ncbi:MAG: carbohydrate-binding domain-containing protein [Candidatus Omnitrophota bacterium]
MLTNKVLLTVAFVFLAAIIIAPLIAELQFNAAQKVAVDYLWEKAEKKFEKAMLIDPFDASHPSGFADFLIDISPYRTDGGFLLKKAIVLYGRSLKLDSLNAEYALGEGKAYLMLFLRDEVRDKTYLVKTLSYFKQALKNDPHGTKTAYEVGCRLMGAWPYLIEEGKSLAMKRLSFVLSEEPWLGWHIYKWAWLNTNNFSIMQRIAPETLKGQEDLLSYLEQNNLHQFYLQQSQIIKAYKGKENPIVLADEKRKIMEIIDVINKKKGSYPPADVIKTDVWYGKSANGKYEYEAGNMYWNGTIFGILEASGGEETITIQAKGSPVDGIYPYMIIAVDGDEIAEALVGSSEWKDYSFRIKTNPGPKLLSITFLNDAEDPVTKEDRNLYIGEARISKNE